MTTPAPAAKSLVKAGVYSALFGPGAGHWYLGERKKAIAWILVTTLLMGRFLWITFSAINQQLNRALEAGEIPDPAAFKISYPPEYGWISLTLSLLWIGAIVDAVRIAQRLQAERLARAITPLQTSKPS